MSCGYTLEIVYAANSKDYYWKNNVKAFSKIYALSGRCFVNAEVLRDFFFLRRSLWSADL